MTATTIAAIIAWATLFGGIAYAAVSDNHK